MNILIIGKSGSGKSNLGDLVKTTIFKMDSNAIIHTDDPDRTVKTFGAGSNKYNIFISQLKDGETISDMMPYALLGQDVIVILNNEVFAEWFRTVYHL